MIIKSKYKIARRLGPEIFDKTQTQKFALRAEKRAGPVKHGRAKSDFGNQLIEKQKARYTYGINERQFAKYVAEALAQKAHKADEHVYVRLETRLDNVAYRIGLAPSRQAARQMVSHGHLLVNGVRVTVPSYNVKKGDKITIREASIKKPLFSTLEEKIKDHTSPAWLSFDIQKKAAEVQGRPVLVKTDLAFDIAAILEFYRR
jgi:small subunit ribosomal protein S4